MTLDGVEVRGYWPRDRQQVLSLLDGLEDLYPGAARWLERCLVAQVARRSYLWVAVAHDEVVGVVIVVPKGERRFKLANLYVAPAWRRRGLGRALVQAASGLWSGGDRPEVVCTVATVNQAAVQKALAPFGFAHETTVADRYGPGRDEAVLILKPRRYVLALRSHHARRIYERTKTWEFRRVRARIAPGDVVLIYESGGVGAITGEFTVKETTYGEPAAVLTREPNERSRADAAEYLAGAKHATAMRAGNVRRYPEPVTLASVGVVRAPQSYQQLDD